MIRALFNKVGDVGVPPYRIYTEKYIKYEIASQGKWWKCHLFIFKLDLKRALQNNNKKKNICFSEGEITWPSWERFDFLISNISDTVVYSLSVCQFFSLALCFRRFIQNVCEKTNSGSSKQTAYSLVSSAVWTRITVMTVVELFSFKWANLTWTSKGK